MHRVRRARPLVRGALAVALLVASGVSRAAVGTGDFTFWADAAAFLGPGGDVIEEIAIRVPNDQLRWVEDGDGWSSRVRLSVRVERPGGDVVYERAKTLRFSAEALEVTRRPVAARTVVRRVRLEPGTYDVSVAVENLDAPKRTLVGMMKNRVATSIVRRMRVRAPRFPLDRVSISDPRFVWDVRRGETGTEWRPNPSRLYGLYRDTLTVYLELYVPDSLADAPAFTVGSEILDDTLGVVAHRVLEVANPGTRWGVEGLRAFPLVVREDLARVPAGAYTLYVTFAAPDGATQRVPCGRFSVAWDLHTWETPRRDYLAEARFLLQGKDFDEFAKLEPGEQERRLAELWKQEDPDPDTAVNEAYEEFLARLDYVRRNYVEDSREAFSPRAEIYLRYGEPDEIVEDVIPVNRDALIEAIALVEDPYHAINASTHGMKPSSGGRQTGNHIVDPRNLSGKRQGDNASYAFELWIYTERGEPILERDRLRTMEPGMRFLFVDREGYGRYHLESSSNITDK